MPDFSLMADEDFDTTSVASMSLSNTTPADYEQAANLITPRSYGAGSIVAGSAGLGIVDLVDTVAAAVPGIERGAVNEKVLQMVDSPGLTNFYRENQGAIEIASGLYGIVASEYLTRGLISEAAPFAAAIRANPVAKRIMALDTDYKKALEAVAKADIDIASRGLLGAQQYDQTVQAAKIFEGVTDLNQMVKRSTLANQATTLGATKTALRFGASEAVLAATMHENDFLYTGDFATDIGFAAMGIGIGGALGNVQAKWAMRSFVNSEKMQMLYAGALDASGMERNRLDMSRVAAVGDGERVDPAFLDSFQGRFTNRATSLAVEGRAVKPVDVDNSTFNRIQLQAFETAVEEAHKASVKGIYGVSGTGFSLGADGYTSTLRASLKKDPGVLLGAEMVGGVGDGMSVSSVWSEFQSNLERLEKKFGDIIESDRSPMNDPSSKLLDALEGMAKVQAAKKLTPQVIIDGEALPLSAAEVFDGWVEPVVKRSGSEGLYAWEATSSEGRPYGIGIDSDGSLYLPNGKTINDLDTFDMLRLYRSANNLVGHAVSLGRDFKMNLASDSSWFHYDLAERILQATDGRANIIFPPGMTRETAQIESLAQKLEAVWARGAEMDDVFKMRVYFNLPQLSAYEIGLLQTTDSPVDALFRSLNQKGLRELRQTPYNELLDVIRKAASVSDLTANVRSKVTDLMGNSFEFMTHEISQGQRVPSKPIMVMKRPFAVEDWTRDNLAERLAMQKVHVAEALVRRGDKSTAGITQMILNSADFQTSARASSLADVQMSAATPGFGNAAPTSARRSFFDSFSTREWKFRDNPIVLAATRVRETAERAMQSIMRQDFERAFTSGGRELSVLDEISGPRNEASKMLLDQFHTFAAGWVIKKEAVRFEENGKSLYRFVLDDVAENQERFRKQFGREMRQGEFLTNSRGNEVVLDDLAMKVQTRFNDITSKLRGMKNSVNQALGLETIRDKPWYTPALDTEGKYIGYTYDARGKAVPGGTIVADTEADFNKQLAAMQADPNSYLNREGHTFLTLNEIKQSASMLDKAELELINPGRTFFAGGRKSMGVNVRYDHRPGAFDESLRMVRNQYLQHGRDIVQTLYRDQLTAAKIRAEVASATILPNAANEAQRIKNRSIFDHYIEALTGQAGLTSKKSWIGRKYNELENSANALLREGAPRFEQWKANLSYERAKNYLSSQNPYMLSKTEQEEFEKMTAQLGQYMPFKTAAEFVEARKLGSRPKELGDYANELNKFEATWILRMLEPVQALMNIAGIVNAAPAVIRHMERRAGESLEAYAQRVGHTADIFNTPDGKSFGVLNMGKMVYEAFRTSMNPERFSKYAKDIQFATRQGTLLQEVAEFQRAFGAIDSKTAWDRFINGDEIAAKKTKALGGRLNQAKGTFQERGLVGWLSVLTDKSEDFSRFWGHMVGLKLADELGIAGEATRHNFAHDIANKMIANYSPQNRPEVFQGAIGAPIGLFQSFIWNYYQRMFRYLETGDARALATQYVMQAGLFGAKTVPGYQALNEFVMAMTDGENDPYSAVVNRMGHDAGSWLMAGTLGNLPKLLGLDAADLTSRGDTQVRVPVLTPPAVIATAQKLFGGIGQAAEAMLNGGLTTQQVGEVLSNSIPNRSIAGLIEQTMAGGRDTDFSGQLVAESKSLMESTYRVLGTRSMRQAAELEAFYMNKRAQEEQASRQDILRRQTRSMFRDGMTQDDLLKSEEVFQRYVDNGGDPRYYKRWLRDNFKSATETRSERQLESALKSETRQAEARRLMNLYSSLESERNEPEVDDTTYSAPDSMDGPMPVATAGDDPSMIYIGAQGF